jgi:hypothetical protein
MSTIKLEVQHPNGKREAVTVEGERALIGSASHCDVRLPMEESADEHVLIEALGGTLRAEAKADHPPATINDMPLTLATLSPGAVLGVGRIRLTVGFVADFGAAQELKAKRRESSTAATVALIAILGTAAYLLLMDTESRIARAPAEAPALFASAQPSCPPSDPSQALAFAEEQRDLADGKRERMPFAIADGVSAVGLYETAAACFRQGGADFEAAEADEAAGSLERDLTDELRTRALRLSHMLEVKDYELAMRDVVVLRALTTGKTGKYIDWLSTVSKQLQAKGIR